MYAFPSSYRYRIKYDDMNNKCLVNVDFTLFNI